MFQINDERRLVNLAAEDKKAFAKLYEMYSERIKSYLRIKLNGDESTAEDITSITFEKALKNIKSFKWQGISFSSWLYKIANNSLVDYYRRQNSHKTVQLVHDNYPDKNQDVEDRSIRYDSDSRIKSLLSDLSDTEREIVTLKFYEGYTNKSIAKKVDLSESNVGTILHRIMIKLREKTLSRDDIDV